MVIALSQDDEEKISIDEDIIKDLIDLRGYLERRIRDLEEETRKLKEMFKIVDEVILTKSFKKAEMIPVTVSESPRTTEVSEEIPLKTATGTLLATMYVGEEEARIVPTKDLTFTINTPPFQTFFITRILEPMKAKDSEDSQRGIILPNQIFSYETIVEGEVIKEFIIKNFQTRKRLREIISSARWTFDKMYEKIRTSDNTPQ